MRCPMRSTSASQPLLQVFLADSKCVDARKSSLVGTMSWCTTWGSPFKLIALFLHGNTCCRMYVKQESACQKCVRGDFERPEGAAALSAGWQGTRAWTKRE